MSKKIRVVKHYSGVSAGVGADSQPVLSKSVCAAMLAGAMVLGGGVFVSSPAYADGYVDGSGNNIYYGYKTDASYSEARFHIEVDYYDTLEHAQAGEEKGKDPLGKFVRVHYLSNCNKKDGTADNWKFRPMWWFGVPKGLQNVQNITYTRVEKLTNQGNKPFKPAGSSQFKFTNAEGYSEVSHTTYPTPKDWKGISNFYLEGNKVLASKGWKQLLGIDDKGSKWYDNAGNTANQWESYQKETAGLQGIFVDWESAGQRFYDMTYVAEMTKQAWEERNEHPLRFAAGVYRFAGNWHYAVGQKHNTPKIADHLKLVYPKVTPVKDLSNVSTDEQNTIKEKIEKANANTKNFKELVADNGVVVNKDGSATITFKDKTTRTMPAALLVVKNEEDKDKYKPTMPERTPVVNLNKLTHGEKTKVRQAIIDANGKGTPNEFLKHIKKDSTGGYDFKVADNGVVSVEYQDGSKITIPASELVYQGATIADWAPYVVPDTIEVDDLKKLKQDEINNIIKAFDDANTGITPYDEAKTQNGGKAPVTVDDKTGTATITWKDGSTTTIAAWQFLKQKPKTPSPEPPTPAPTAEKEFIVEAPKNQSSVDFDPFNAKESDLTDNKNKQALTSIKEVLKKCAAKDAKDNNTSVTIKDVEFKIVDGKGVVVFHAEGYKDATYPMSVFLKQKANKQTPTPDTNLHHPGKMTAYNYYVDPVQVDNVNSPSGQDQIAAFKKFMKKNYNVDITNQEAVSAYTLKENDKPVAGVTNMQRYVQGQNNGAGVVSFSLNADGTIAVQGFETGENSSKKLFDVPLTDLYVKKNSSQPQKDNTIEKLKEQAKALLKQRQDDGLTNDDLRRAGISDPDQLNNDKIDSIAKGQTAEKDLRDLIRKLTDAKKAEYKYNTDPYEADKGPNDANFSVTDDMFKGAVKKFLHANYDDTNSNNKIDNIEISNNSLTLDSKGWTPKTGTSNLELNSTSVSYGISSLTMSTDGTGITFKNGETVLFTVSKEQLFKKKDATPAPTPDALAQMKKDAKQQIDRNPNLTKEQKEDYKNQIGKATTADAIKEILKAAAEKGKENAKSTDTTTQQTINNNKGGGDAKKEAEKKQKEKEDKKQEDKKNTELEDKRKKASEEIGKLSNLSDDDKSKLNTELTGDGTQANSGADTPEAVQNILDKAKAINDAKGTLQNDIKKGALPFLDHGTGDDKNNTADTHADDAALNELLGTKSGKDSTLTALETELAKTNPEATSDELNKALDAAKKANALNEQKAKDEANRQLTEKKDALDNAYNALTDQQKQSAKDKYDAAITAINGAKDSVTKATTPSQIKKALDDLKTAIGDANTAIENAKGKRDTSGNDNDNADALTKEKNEQKKRIQDSNLPDAEKKKAIEAINGATKLGDPTGIADRALKAQKIKDALEAIDKLEHLNDAQKKAYKDIINGTDAGNHKDDDGKDTGVDDIDDALANATNTDTAMARLEELKKKANDFKNEQGGKYSKLTNSEDDQNKKKAFDKYLDDATKLTTADQGDAKTADQVNDLYKDLLKAMQAIDKDEKGAGVNTDALSKEIESDKKLKPDDQANPKTPGDSVYTTASQDKKTAFDTALSEAETALQTAENTKKPGAKTMDADAESKAQKAVDEALDKLIKARLALDGVDTKPLQEEIDKDGKVTSSVKYTNADADKKQAFDKALKDAQDLIAQLTGTANQQAQPGSQGTQQPGGQQTELKTKEQKQNALDKALKALQKAYNELNGSTPEPTPTPADVDKTDLAAEIALDNTIGRRISYIISPSDKQDAYNDALAEARRVYGDPNATQEQVNAAAAALRRAAAALSGYGSVDNDVNPLPTPSPLPSPLPGGGAGFGVNDNAPTTVDKGELNVQIDSAEADSKPGNAGDGAGNGNANAGNAGNANAGNAGSAPNAQGGAGASAGAGAGAGTTGAAPTGVDNKAVNNAVENAPEVKQADTAVKQAAAALDDALAQAKRVAADPHATQAQVDAAARRLADARKALADAKANAANVRAAVRNRVIKNMRSRGGAGIATGADVATAGLMATMLAAIGGAFATRRIRTKHANRD
ncbi:GA module [Bifidobacterium sp. UMB1197]|nr:GA module [Bifidobacterium sp. UMB1197]